MTVPRCVALLSSLAFLAWASSATAQSSTSGSSFNAGYGLASGQLQKGVDVSRGSNGNLVIVDGVTQTGSDQSIFSTKSSSGAADSYTGAGSVGGTAIGNNLQVTVTGSYNTVIVNSSQTNSGAISAKTALNGQVSLDGN